MRILYLFRDSDESKYILTELQKRSFFGTIILETGTVARKKKLRRLFQKTGIFRILVILLDLFALWMYLFWSNRALSKILGRFKYPPNSVSLRVDDANENQCIAFIQRYRPELIFVFGTSILSSDFLESINVPVINIHTGIVPFYRNVHSDFWAFVTGDYRNIGVSLFYIDPGIDTGDIVLQKAISYRSGDSIFDCKRKILELIPNLVADTIQMCQKGILPRKKQNAKQAGFYKTPGFVDLIRLL